IERFPDYRRIDGVYYLIGYCLNEMGQPDKARLAWLNMVCANNFDFRRTFAEENAALADQAEREARNPSLTIGGITTNTSSGPLPDLYATCQPAVESPRFAAETWLRIGEYHFDFDSGP